jgi:hypothetical protein
MFKSFNSFKPFKQIKTSTRSNRSSDFDCCGGVVLKGGMKAMEDDNGTGDAAR